MYDVNVSKVLVVCFSMYTYYIILCVNQSTKCIDYSLDFCNLFTIKYEKKFKYNIFYLRNKCIALKKCLKCFIIIIKILKIVPLVIL